jgi:hypothetical protein
MPTNLKHIGKNSLLVLFVGFILALSLRGLPGNPDAKTFLNKSYLESGPLELSPERGRFALTYAIAELHSYAFSLPLARFATPDVGYTNGQYVSLFAPGVSFVILPGFILGSLVDLSQVGSFAVIALFALCNFFLVAKISRLLGASGKASYIGAVAFLFATPAFSYGVSLYQHHISVFLMLTSLFLLFRYQSPLSRVIIWILIGAGFFVDYPNAFLMLPIALYALAQAWSISDTAKKIAMRINVAKLATVFFAVVPLLFLLWYNNSAYGNPLQLAGTIDSVDSIDARGNPVSKVKVNGKIVNIFTTPDLDLQVTTTTAFQTRNLLNGLYIHFLSPDRGILFFAPIVYVGIAGFFWLYKRDKRVILFIAIAGINILLYSMWGDPWGGWAFGSRYLIPTYALSGISIALFLPFLLSKRLLAVVFSLVLVYSVFVNTLGALTTSKMPPKIQVLSLEKQTHREEKYTYARNLQYISSGESSSFVFHAFADQVVPAYIYLSGIFGAIVLFLIFIAGPRQALHYLVTPKQKVLHVSKRGKRS